MQCPKCKSENVNIQAVTEIVKRKRGFLWWLLIGWWWSMIKLVLWVLYFVPMLIIKAIRKNKVKSKTTTQAICQTCGHRWKIK